MLAKISKSIALTRAAIGSTNLRTNTRHELNKFLKIPSFVYTVLHVLGVFSVLLY